MSLKTRIFKSILFKNNVHLPLRYWVLVVLRFFLTALPQRGYLHPDEFFQNIEIMAGDIFSVDVARTWEFNPKAPIRNIFIPKLLLAPPLHFIRLISPYTEYYLNLNLRTPYFLVVIPRLFVCLLSFINDYCLYRICVIYGQNFKNRLVIFATSYVVLVYCCRCFSNTFEMIFFSLLLLLVADCMSKSDKIIYHDEFLREKYDKAKTPVEKVKLFKLKLHLPNHSLSHVVIISTLVTVGIFNRPTFIGFAFPPLFFWLQRGLGTKVVGFKDFHIRILILMLCAVPSALVLIVIDSVYYGYLTNADVESLKFSWQNWVVTPLNFLRYNSDTHNLTNHGLHPRWFHLAVNMPLLFNVLGIMAFFTLSTNTYRFIRAQYSKLPRIQSITGLMLFSFVMPLALLSLVPHQEARFIIPVLIPLVYLFGNYLHANESDGPTSKRIKKIILCAWFTINAMQTLFYGFVHQGGVFPFVNRLHAEVRKSYDVHTHVVTTHTYSIPTFLLQLPSTTKVWKNRSTGQKYRKAPTTFLHKYGSLPMKGLLMKVDDVLTDAEMFLHEFKTGYNFYVASPCALEKDLRQAAQRYNYFRLAEEFSYYPHFCTEAFPTFPSSHDQYCIKNNFSNRTESQVVELDLFERISCFFSRFCLRIYRVETIHFTKS